jgi:hypothetical protein
MADYSAGTLTTDLSGETHEAIGTGSAVACLGAWRLQRFGGAGAGWQTGPATVMPATLAADVGSVDGIVAALYDVISGPAGKQRDWNRLRSRCRRAT